MIAIIILITILLTIGVCLFVFYKIFTKFPSFDEVNCKIEEDKKNIIIDEGKITIEKKTLKAGFNKSTAVNELDIYEITGYIKNNSDQDLMGLVIEFKLFSKTGVVLGIASYYIDPFKAGETWRFIAEGFNSTKDVDRFELIKVAYLNQEELKK